MLNYIIYYMLSLVFSEMMDTSSSYSHTCITCRVVFARAELQRDHYKTDWHRYNLKRKVAELPSVSAEAFQQKVLEMKTSVAEQDAEVHRCSECNKVFQTAAAYENHLKSKKHADIAKSQEASKRDSAKFQELLDKGDVLLEIDDRATTELKSETNAATLDSESEVDELDENEGLSVEECLFCSNVGINFDENIKHMSVAHGFFIPDAEFCVDIEGLINYLGEKVAVGFVCLWCNDRGKSFRTLDAVQKHMRDKGHCKMLHDGEAMLEYSDYFDFSSSYPDAATAGDDDLDADVDLPLLEERDWQLVLPSGATIGHRSLMRYYRQRLKDQSQVVAMSDKKRAVHQLLSQYRALGWTGTSGVDAQRKARDIGFMRKLQLKREMQVGVKANKLQKHFRSQIDF